MNLSTRLFIPVSVSLTMLGAARFGVPPLLDVQPGEARALELSEHRPQTPVGRDAAEDSWKGEVLQELRGLRRAVERLASTTTRGQMLIGRLQMQDQRLRSLGEQLQQARTELLQIQQKRQSTLNEIDTARRAAAIAQTGEERHQMEAHATVLQRELKDTDNNLAEHVGRTSALAETLSSEQARWLDINARLEELERDLMQPKPE